MNFYDLKIKLTSLSYKLKFIRQIMSITAFIASIALLVGIVLDFGFYYNPKQQYQLNLLYYFVWIVFLVILTFRLVVEHVIKEKRGRIQTIITGSLIYLTLIPYVFYQPSSDSFLYYIWMFLNSKYFFLASLFLFAIANISNGIVKLVNKKTNPALMLASSFFIIIIIGTVLLLLPRCTTSPISIVDALFISTSAVCVTGLTPLEVSSIFTIEGQFVIILLIQIGGLGVMTLTSFFALFFMGSTGLYNQIAIKDMISLGSINSLVATLLYILGFTLAIEAIGMFFIFTSIHGTLGLTINQELFFAGFHSVSAFCNAGFSTLQGNLGNSLLISEHNMFFITISCLIILGGIGFPILMNFKNVIKYHINKFLSLSIKKGKDFKRVYHITDLNTKIVLFTTFLLLVFGTALMAFFEWNNAFANMPFIDKLVQSFFNAVSPRTAGFTSIDLTHFSIQSLLIYLFLMWVGGAAQSTAGGIKVNVFAVAWLNFVAMLRGTERIDVYGRELAQSSIRRANATIFISLLTISSFVFIISYIEPNIPLFNIVFECFSAIGTVGSSLNTTAILSEPSKILITILMFIGRVGVVTLLLSFIPQKKNLNYKLPQGQIIIN